MIERCEECQRDPWRIFPNGSCVKCNELNHPAVSETTLEQRLLEAQDKIEKIIENHCRCIPADPHLCTACKILDELRRLGE